MQERLDWENYFMKIAFTIAKRATCPVRKVGAVFVDGKTNTALSMGYNGAPRGTSHCDSCDGRKTGENTQVCKAVHAETNAIFNAARQGISLDGSTCYLTISPCGPCARALVQVGCLQVIYAEPYPNLEAHKLFQEAEVSSRIFLMQSPWWDDEELIEYV